MIYMDTLTKVYMIYMDTDPLGLPSALFGAEPISLQKTWMQSEDLDAKSVKLRKFWLEQSVQSLNMVLSESFGVNNEFWCEQWIQSFGFLSIVFSESLGVSNNRSSTSFVEFISCRNHFFQVSSTKHCSQRKIGRTHRAQGISF